MPKQLSYKQRWCKETRDFWKRVTKVYDFQAEAIDILYGACENLELFYLATEEVRRDGVTFKAPSGQIRVHPAAAVAKAAWAGYLSGVRALKLEDDLPKPKIGRPLRTMP